MATNFEPHECVIFVQSTKIGTHENKAIQNITCFAIHSFFFPLVYITFIQSHASFPEREDNYGNFKMSLIAIRKIITRQDDLIIVYKISSFVFFPIHFCILRKVEKKLIYVTLQKLLLNR